MSQPSLLARLWAYAQTAITALCASLLPLDTLSAGERRKLRAWLGALEAFCRRIALTEALTLARAGLPAPARKPSARSRPSKRRPTLRLWPSQKPASARIRLLAAPTSVREIVASQQRAALTARLAAGRTRDKPPHLRIADRIEALRRFLDAPRAAVRRFARKLLRSPGLARAIVARRAPRSPQLSQDHVDASEMLAFAALNSS